MVADERARSSLPASSATIAKTAAGSAPEATSVATRRSAACSSATASAPPALLTSPDANDRRDPDHPVRTKKAAPRTRQRCPDSFRGDRGSEVPDGNKPNNVAIWGDDIGITNLSA